MRFDIRESYLRAVDVRDSRFDILKRYVDFVYKRLNIRICSETDQDLLSTRVDIREDGRRSVHAFQHPERVIDVRFSTLKSCAWI